MNGKFLAACLPALLVSACLFGTGGENPETSGSLEIRPDLEPGNEWMYVHRQFTDFEDGTQGDTLVYFIHYAMAGDTLIAGTRYRILVEEDLALFNTDLGLVKNRSAYAILADSSGIRVKALRGGEQATGRFPMKAAAGPAFDTAHFMDEVTVLKAPLGIGTGWSYRDAGNPSGIWAATKTFVARESLSVGGRTVPALKFRLEVESLEHVRTYEWYAENVKVFSRSSSSATFAGKDSSRSEEEYLGKRNFTGRDTLAVLKGTIFDPGVE